MHAVRSWLLAAVALHVVVNLVIVGGLCRVGYDTRAAIDATAPAQLSSLTVPMYDTDSWYPMLLAYGRRAADPATSLYAPFFEDGVKFQYPPSSLLVVDLLPPAMRKLDGENLDPGLMRWLTWLTRIATLLTVATSVLVLDRRQGQRAGARKPLARAVTAAAAFLLAITLYRRLRGHMLTQIQVFLNLLVALAVFCHVTERPRAAGACLGACCMFKPQLGIVLLWSALRRRWDVALGFVAVAVPVTVIALLRFGITDYLDYLDVLRIIGRHGETFWANQSINGLANRLLANGDPVEFWDKAYAPYHPVVYALTVASSLALIACALSPRACGRRLGGGVDDLLVVLAAATIASPVAWEHHYGVFLPICAASLPAVVERRPLGRTTGPVMAVAFAAMANVVLAPEIIFANRVRGLLGSHLLFGALAILALLLAARGRGREEPAPAAGSTTAKRLGGPAR